MAKPTAEEYIRYLLPDFAVLVDLEERFIRNHLSDDTVDPAEADSVYYGLGQNDGTRLVTDDLMKVIGGGKTTSYDTGFYRIIALSDGDISLSGCVISATYDFNGRKITAGISERTSISVSGTGGGRLTTVLAF